MTIVSKAAMLAAAFACVLMAAEAPAAEEQKLSGTVRVEQVQIAFIGSGNLGGGHLQYEGQSHGFTIGGLGIGGFGISKIAATGEVYNLATLADFAGVYGQARYGFALGTLSQGELWLQNPQGVYLRLKAEREGLMLTLGADAMYISLD